MIESLFGAAFIDSKGDLTQCGSLVNRISVFSSPHRMTRNSIDVVHPKSRLAGLLPGERVTHEFRGGDESGIEKWGAA